MTTDELVDEFALVLKAHMRIRERQGKAGWDEPYWKRECLEKLKESAQNEEIFDTVGYAMFAYYHGWGEL